MDGGGGGVISGQSAPDAGHYHRVRAIVSRSIIGTGKDTQQRGRNGHCQGRKRDGGGGGSSSAARAAMV
jgi:hypothetical protein